MAAYSGVYAAEPDPAWRVDGGASLSRLSGGQPDWRDSYFGLTYRPDLKTWWTARLEHSDRFNLTDTVVGLRFARVSAKGFSGHLETAIADDADFRARARLEAGVLSHRIPISANWSLAAGLDGAVASYRTGEVSSLQPHVVLSRARGAKITARIIETWDEFDRHRRGYAVRAEAPITRRASVMLSYVDAPESDLGVTVEIEAFAAAVLVEISDGLALRAGVEREARPSYDRHELNFGVTRRF